MWDTKQRHLSSVQYIRRNDVFDVLVDSDLDQDQVFFIRHFCIQGLVKKGKRSRKITFC